MEKIKKVFIIGNNQVAESLGNGRVKLIEGVEYTYVSDVQQATGSWRNYELISEEELSDPNRVSGSEEDENIYGAGLILNSYDDDASLIESIITHLLMLLGTGFYAIMTLVIGEESFSIEKVIFNGYPNTRLAFFENDFAISGNNPFIEENGLRDILNNIYNFFSGITMVVYLVILVYMGIRVMLGATAERGSRYKELVLYWLQGVVILFLFPYIMRYAINFNDAFVSFLYSSKNTFQEMETPEIYVEEGDLKGLKGLITKLYNMLLTDRRK